MTVADAYFTHVTEQGTSFEIPEQWQPDPKQSACRSCRAPIVWCKTPRGKRAPVNPDGTSHFSTCPQADRWRKQEAPAEADPAPTDPAQSSGPSLRGAVRAALTRIGTLYDPPTIAQTEAFARALSEELRASGFAIHDARLCVRVQPPEAYGRPMTDEEMRSLLGARQAEQLAEAEA